MTLLGKNWLLTWLKNELVTVVNCLDQKMYSRGGCRAEELGDSAQIKGYGDLFASSSLELNRETEGGA